MSVCYLQYKNAGIIELEACLKACRVLIKHKVSITDLPN